MKTHDAGDVHLIVAVTLSNENSITISMWKKQVTARHQGKHERPTALYILDDSASCHTFGGHGCNQDICIANDGECLRLLSGNTINWWRTKE